jgi:hypothetical protein
VVVQGVTQVTNNYAKVETLMFGELAYLIVAETVLLLLGERAASDSQSAESPQDDHTEPPSANSLNPSQRCGPQRFQRFQREPVLIANCRS